MKSIKLQQHGSYEVPWHAQQGPRTYHTSESEVGDWGGCTLSSQSVKVDKYL